MNLRRGAAHAEIIRQPDIEGGLAANGRPVDPKLWRLYASSSTPYRINLGNEWVEVPPPELFDLWTKAN